MLPTLLLFAAPPAPDFARDVRPVLVAKCFACHGPDKQKAGLRFDNRAAALAGGRSGPVVVAGKPAESELIDRVSSKDAARAMPPKGERLTAAEVGALTRWVTGGADWPKDETWWAFRDLTKPTPPAGAQHPVDAYIEAELRRRGLTPTAEADARTLVRRLFFDLTGLPPTPERVAQYSADPAPNKYAVLVDELLASLAYGERYARHWLDVAHYGDTHGYDKDQPRPNAWPYRDYVIRSLNAGKPYSRFLREQIAGDVLFPGTKDGITATGFLAAGPWDLIGHAEVPETKIDGKIARHLDRDDVVGTVVNTVLGVTVQCAQCHDHKFDPIKQKDYYALQAVFAAIDRADRPYHDDPKAAALYAAASAQRRKLADRVRVLTAGVADLDRQIAAAGKPAAPAAEFGYHSQLAADQTTVKWVQVDLGRSVALSKVVVWPCYDDFNNIGAGFGYPVRFKIEAGENAEFRGAVAVIADRTAADVPNPGVKPQSSSTTVTARYVRVTATKLAARQNDFMLALAELEIIDAAGSNLAAGKPVLAKDSIEAGPRWRKSNLTDGHAPGRTAGDAAALEKQRAEKLAATLSAAERQELEAAEKGIVALDAEVAKNRPTGSVYAGTVHYGSGAFRGTGPDGGKPRPVFLLPRGDMTKPGESVPPAAPNFFHDLPGDLRLKSDHTEGDRRAALATWLTDPRNPLTWRVIVNRVWQAHFGRGLAATGNDFGQMGQPPTHPQLLDYLAAEFRDGDQSLKSLHRLIVTSAAYKRASTDNPANEASDAGNSYYWRGNRRKLEAEVVRDSVLFIAGKLDRSMYGPPYKDFVVTHPEHSPHYEYGLWDPKNPAAYRRAVYRFIVRSKPQPFMTVLDCADPSMQVDKRTESLSPLQALALYNNGLMLAAAGHLAERVKPAGDVKAQVALALRLATAREPTAAELEALTAHATKYGAASACRVVLNLTEVLFAD